MKTKGKFFTLISAVVALTVLFAAGCGSDDSDSESATTTTAGVETTTTIGVTATTVVEEVSSQTYTLDEVQEIFQAGFDRSHPFQSVDEFCQAQPSPSIALEASAPGITEEEVVVVHIRSKLEELASIGFATNVGDPKEMFEVFTQVINEECGGVHGRQIRLETIEVSALGGAGADINTLRNAACIEAIEDHNAVFVINTTGFQGSAGVCLAEESIFISTQGQPEEAMEAGNGNLISLSVTLDESLEYMAQFVLDSGVLEGKTIGIVVSDTPGHPETVEIFKDTLEDNGVNVAVFDIIGCEGGTSCNIGVADSVTRLIDEGVDVLFPTLNVVSLPGYIREMSTQGIEPGDIQFYNSDFNSQAGDLVSSKVVQFGGEDSGDLYNGALIIDDARTGAFREAGFEETPFNKMCAETYYSISEARWDPFDADENSPYGMIGTVCSGYRIALRALYDAGPNPTREDLTEAVANLGPVDLNNMLPGSISDGKYSLPDAIHTMVFSYPCSQEGTGTDQDTCILSLANDEWLFVN